MTFEEFKRKAAHAPRYYIEAGCYWAEFGNGWVSYDPGNDVWLVTCSHPERMFVSCGSDQPSVEAINRVR